MNNIKVSVIIPVYNTEQYLRECLDSVINQTLKDIEIICVNDGSTDKSMNILEEYSKKDNRIRVITQENSGMGRAYNTGLDAAKGKYIGFVESDDYVASSMFEVLYNYAEENKTDVVKSGYFDNFNLDEYKSIKKINWYSAEHLNNKVFSKNEAKLFLSFHPSIWTCLYKSEFLVKNSIRFSENKPCAWADNLFQVQTLCMAEKIFYTDEAFYYWRRKNTDDSKDLRNYNVPVQKIIEIHKWLNENGFDDADTLAYLCKRELRYLEIVIKKLNIINLLSGIKAMHKLAGVFDKRLVDSLGLDITERNKIKIFLKSSTYYVLINKTKLILKPVVDKITDLIMLSFMQSGKKIVFWGGSIFLEEFLEKYDVKNKNVLGIIDKDKTKENSQIGVYTVYQPEKLSELNPDIIIFTIKNRHEIIYPKIKEYLEKEYPHIKLIFDLFIT